MTDRRVRRTREAIRTAFNHLVFTREFDQIRIDDILGAANVARSTFYQHYTGKDDLLCAVMSFILEPLAGAGAATEPSPGLLLVAEHLWDNRRLARAIFWGSTRTAIVRDLARRIEHELRDTQSASGLPVPYVAGTMAEWQVASLEQWLMGRHRLDARSWALALCRGTRGLAAALTGIDHAG